MREPADNLTAARQYMAIVRRRSAEIVTLTDAGWSGAPALIDDLRTAYRQASAASAAAPPAEQGALRETFAATVAANQAEITTALERAGAGPRQALLDDASAINATAAPPVQASVVPTPTFTQTPAPCGPPRQRRLAPPGRLAPHRHPALWRRSA